MMLWRAHLEDLNRIKSVDLQGDALTPPIEVEHFEESEESETLESTKYHLVAFSEATGDAWYE